MLLPERRKKRQVMLSIGMLSLAVGLLFPMVIYPSANPGANWSHWLRGFLIGLSIPLNLMAIRLKSRERHCG